MTFASFWLELKCPLDGFFKYVPYSFYLSLYIFQNVIFLSILLNNSALFFMQFLYLFFLKLSKNLLFLFNFQIWCSRSSFSLLAQFYHYTWHFVVPHVFHLTKFLFFYWKTFCHCNIETFLFKNAVLRLLYPVFVSLLFSYLLTIFIVCYYYSVLYPCYAGFRISWFTAFCLDPLRAKIYFSFYWESISITLDMWDKVFVMQNHRWGKALKCLPILLSSYQHISCLCFHRILFFIIWYKCRLIIDLLSAQLKYILLRVSKSSRTIFYFAFTLLQSISCIFIDCKSEW